MIERPEAPVFRHNFGWTYRNCCTYWKEKSHAEKAYWNSDKGRAHYYGYLLQLANKKANQFFKVVDAYYDAIMDTKKMLDAGNREEEARLFFKALDLTLAQLDKEKDNEQSNN